jgi:hypothetical protein
VTTLRMYLQERRRHRIATLKTTSVWVDDGTTETETSRWSFLSIDELEKLPPPQWLIPAC